MKTILFDLGGVLTLDPWESICLTPQRGLGARLGVRVEVMHAAGVALWPAFSTGHRLEADYWAGFSRLIGIDIPMSLVDEVAQDTLLVNPIATQLLAKAAQVTPGRVGIISDNTNFFFKRQNDFLGLEQWVNQDLVLLSHVVGLHKREAGYGLFERAADLVDPSQTLILDDRDYNVMRARKAGFITHLVDDRPLDVRSCLTW